MLKVGITGGIGAGKSVVTKLFKLLGVPVYDSDSRAKWVMRHNEALKAELIEAYGTQAYTETGELDRAYIASIVFNNPEQLQQLNKLVHPHVRQDFSEWQKQHADKPYILKEAALMYESEAWQQMDRIITVFAPLDVRIKRLVIRDTHRTEADIRAIISKQLSEEEKIARADYLIMNDDQKMVIPQVLALHQELLSLAATY